VRLATRGSELALRQARAVAALLRDARSGITLEEKVVHTRGDRAADVPLDRIGGQGAFVKEVQAAVLDGRADLAVHSAKDLPSDNPAELTIAAVPRRGDPRDALVGGRLAELVPGATVATGSARRRAQLANLRPDLTFVDLRGNMATRVGRAGDGDVDVVVVAKVALDRLGWTDRIDEVLEPSILLPQAGQGAIAIECRADDAALVELLASIDDPWSHLTLDAERAVLWAMAANCSTPVAAWAEPGRPDEGRILLHALTASLDGRVVVRSELCGDEPRSVGIALAERLVTECGARVTGEPMVVGSDGGLDSPLLDATRSEAKGNDGDARSGTTS
jgi:hydroxymethylbilane synthase